MYYKLMYNINTKYANIVMIKKGQASKMIDPRGRLKPWPQDLVEDEDGRPN